MGQTQLEKLREFKRNPPKFVDRKDVSLKLDGNIISVEYEFINGSRLVHELEPSVFLDALKELNLRLHEYRRTPHVRNKNISLECRKFK